MNAPDVPEESPSLAAMIRAMQDGEPVDKDALRDALMAKGEQLGLPRKELARFAGRARWEAEREAGRVATCACRRGKTCEACAEWERQKGNRGEEEAG